MGDAKWERDREIARDTVLVLRAIFCDRCADGGPREVAIALKLLYAGRMAWLQDAILIGIDFATFAEGTVALEDALGDDDDDDGSRPDYASFYYWLKAVRAELLP
jgi:hypothetical protein